MNRKIKKGSGVYAFLESTGVLEMGSAENIAAVKKQYWETVRKEWKNNKRKICKSYTIFYDTNELKMITQSANKQHNSITTYIKQASLTYGTNHVIVDRKVIGEIREALAFHYNALQILNEENVIPKNITDKLLQEVVLIETKVFSFLKQIACP